MNYVNGVTEFTDIELESVYLCTLYHVFQMNYVNCVTEFTDIELESAKSSLTFLVIEKETTVSDVAHHSILAYLRDIPHSYNKYDA